MPYIKIAQITVAVLLMIAILLQNRGAGMSALFGGTDSVYRTKRGIEKTLFKATIVLTILFFLISLASLIMA